MSGSHRQDGGADTTRSLRYALPVAAGSVWLGLGWLSLTGLAVTVAAVVLLLVAGLPLWAVVPVGAGGAAVAALPLAGRPVLAWLPTLAAHQSSRLVGGNGWVRPLGDGTFERSGAGPSRQLRLGIGPRQLWLLCPDASSDPHAVTLATVAHGGDRRCTVVLEVVALGRFGVLDPAEQDTELARWGSSLAVLYADPSVCSVQWLTHTRPDTRPYSSPTASPYTDRADAPARPDSRGQGRQEDLRADYRHLVEAATRQASRHRHLLAVTLTPTGAASGHRSAADGQRPDQAAPLHVTGGHPVDGAVEDWVTRAARHAATALLGADLLARPVSASELGTEIRLLLDPGAADDGPVPDPARWAPVSTRSSWDCCRTDDTRHRCFTVTGWPRLALSADWLAPLLHDTPSAGTSRTLAVHTRPVAPAPAARRARAASAKARLDASDRSRLGFTPHAGAAVSDTLAETDAAATEAELVAGYRMTDLSALLTISAVDAPHLDLACRQVRALAAAHRLELRPLHGQHLSALAATLPLGLNPGRSS
jgi:hypothetical protein